MIDYRSLSGLGFVGVRGFHKTPIESYGENGRNVQLCCAFTSSSIYDGLQIEGVFLYSTV